MPHFDEDEGRHVLGDEDHAFLADWYQAQDEAADRAIHRGEKDRDESGELTSYALSEEAQTYYDRLKGYLLDHLTLDNLPEPRALMDKVLYFDTLAWLVGAPGSAKSFVALDWAGHVGSGLPWNGFPTVKTNVLYVMPESPGGMKIRKQAWELAMRQPMTGVYFLPVAPQAAEPGQFSALTRVALDVEAGLIILDTQARVTLGLEENSSKDMGYYVAQLDRMRDSTKACILTVHHTSRGNDHLRGSTALEGAAGTIITVKKDGRDLTIEADPAKGGKTKDVEPFDAVHATLKPSGSSAIIALAVNARSGRDISMSVGEYLRTWWQLFGSDPVSVSAIVRNEVMPERTFFNWRKQLVDQGIVEQIGKGRGTTYAMRAGSSYTRDDG